MPLNIHFFSWASAFFGIGLTLLLARRYILRSVPDRLAHRNVIKRLLVMAIMVISLGGVFLILVFAS
jgi:hypothetical protein